MRSHCLIKGLERSLAMLLISYQSTEQSAPKPRTEVRRGCQVTCLAWDRHGKYLASTDCAEAAVW